VSEAGAPDGGIDLNRSMHDVIMDLVDIARARGRSKIKVLNTFPQEDGRTLVVTCDISIDIVSGERLQ
jgi:hypothetical protein